MSKPFLPTPPGWPAAPFMHDVLEDTDVTVNCFTACGGEYCEHLRNVTGKLKF